MVTLALVEDSIRVKVSKKGTGAGFVFERSESTGFWLNYVKGELLDDESMKNLIEQYQSFDWKVVLKQLTEEEEAEAEKADGLGLVIESMIDNWKYIRDDLPAIKVREREKIINHLERILDSVATEKVEIYGSNNLLRITLYRAMKTWVSENGTEHSHRSAAEFIFRAATQLNCSFLLLNKQGDIIV